MKLLVVSLVLIASTACGQWTTNLYQSLPDYRFGYNSNRVAEIGAAIKERANAAGYPAYTNNYWIFGATRELADRKYEILHHVTTVIDGLIEIWPPPTWADRSEMVSGTFDTWFSTTNDFPQLDKDLILSYSGAPTNWFEKTPYFWASTHSNGWEYADEVINEMVVFYQTAKPIGQVYPYKWIWEKADGVSWVNGDTNTWDGAKYLAELDYTSYDPVTNTTGAITTPETWTESWLWHDTSLSNNYEAYFHTERLKLYLTNTLDYAVSIGVYMKGGLVETYYDYEPYTSGISTNWQALVHTTIPAGGSYETAWLGEWWATANDIVWCRAATATDYDAGNYYIFGEGFKASTLNRWHFDFSITNGFEYVEE